MEGSIAGSGCLALLLLLSLAEGAEGLFMGAGYFPQSAHILRSRGGSVSLFGTTARF